MADALYSLTRRHFMQGVGVTGIGLLAGCGLAAPASPPAARIPRIGYLDERGPSADALYQVFQQALRDLGYVEERNVISVRKSVDSERDPLPGVMAGLARLPVELIVVRGDAVARVARDASPTIPVVMALSADPVGTGLVASLAHPGGRVTGVTTLSPQLTGKRLELLKDAAPGVSRVAAFWNPTEASRALDFHEAEAAAQTLGLQLLSLEMRGPADFDSAFATAIAEGANGLLVFAGQLNSSQQARLVDFAQRQRLPAMFALRAHVDAGGLMAYGPSYEALHRRAAYYVGRILKGTSPADLPVEQPREFDFVINLRTAQALGITIPQHVLLQATEIVQ